MLIKNEKGAALVFSMMVLLVLSVLGAAILGTATNNYRLTEGDKDFQSVYYIAEAGIRYQTEEFRTRILEAYENSNNETAFFNSVETLLGTDILDSFDTLDGIQPNATITINRISAFNSNPAVYEIVAEGEIDGAKRKVSREITVQWIAKSSFNFQTDMAVFSIGDITLGGSAAVIDGPIGTNATGPNAINIVGNPTIEDIFLLPNANMSAPNWWLTDRWNSNQYPLPEPRTFDMPEFPDFPVYSKLERVRVTSGNSQHWIIDNNGNINANSWISPHYILDLNQNAYIPQLLVDSNYDLTINIGNTDRKIVVDYLNINQGRLHIQGTGKLTIYVKDRINMGGSARINEPAPLNNTTTKAAIDKLHIYYKGAPSHKNLVLGGSQRIYGSLFAQDANLDITNGGGFLGHIITGGTSVKISGGTYVVTSLLYAPNAYVQLLNGAVVRGPVISNRFFMDGNTRVIFDPSEGVADNPFASDNDVNLEDIIPIRGAIRER